MPKTVVRVDGKRGTGASVGVVVRLRLALQDPETLSVLAALAAFIKTVLVEAEAEDALRALRVEWKKAEVERQRMAQEGCRWNT